MTRMQRTGPRRPSAHARGIELGRRVAARRAGDLDGSDVARDAADRETAAIQAAQDALSHGADDDAVARDLVAALSD